MSSLAERSWHLLTLVPGGLEHLLFEVIDSAFAPRQVAKQVVCILALQTAIIAGALGTDKRGGQDADECDRPVKRTKVDARHLERHNYTRRSLRRVSEEMKWSGKDEFFKVLSDD